jgi:hypothetical protein
MINDIVFEARASAHRQRCWEQAKPVEAGKKEVNDQWL